MNEVSDTVGYSLAFARDMVPARMAPYSAALPPIYQKFVGQYLAIGGPGRGVERLAGDWGERSIMLGVLSGLCRGGRVLDEPRVSGGRQTARGRRKGRRLPSAGPPRTG